MRIGVLTYTEKHRKTYDVLCLLKARGYNDISVYAIPFHYKKTYTPLYQHRPEMNIEYPDIKDLCRAFNFELFEINNYDAVNTTNEDVFLLCGGGVLPEKFIEGNKIINSHPGYLPYARGLDAFKWAIIENHPIGVTTHLIGKEVDAGEIIERRKIPIRKNDTFHAVAQRLYETEVEMLVDSLNKIDEPHEYISGGNYPVHRRMPCEVETQLLEKFEKMIGGGVICKYDIIPSQSEGRG